MLRMSSTAIEYDRAILETLQRIHLHLAKQTQPVSLSELTASERKEAFLLKIAQTPLDEVMRVHETHSVLVEARRREKKAEAERFASLSRAKSNDHAASDATP